MRLVSKRNTILMAVVVMVSFFLGTASAQQMSEEKLKEFERKRRIITAVKKELNGTTWKIDITETGPEGKKKTKKDTLTFEKGKILSSKMSKEGFKQTNFSVRVKKKLIIWETMQTSEEKGVCFWRGEFEENAKPAIMRGVLGWHVSDDDKRDFYFISEEREDFNTTYSTDKPVVQKPKKEEPVVKEEKPVVKEEKPVEVQKVEEVVEEVQDAQPVKAKEVVEEVKEEVVEEVEQVEEEKTEEKEQKFFWQR